MCEVVMWMWLVKWFILWKHLEILFSSISFEQGRNVEFLLSGQLL